MSMCHGRHVKPLSPSRHSFPMKSKEQLDFITGLTRFGKTAVMRLNGRFSLSSRIGFTMWLGIRKDYFVKLHVNLPRKLLCRNFREVGVRSSPIVCEVHPEILNGYFLKSNSKRFLLVNQEVKFRHGKTFQCGAFIEDELNRAVHSSKSNYIGEDNIGIGFIKLVFPSVISPLIHVFNHVIRTYSLPECWGTVKLIPIGKQGILCSFWKFSPN